MTIQRQTIVHNVSDEPIIVEHTDGSQITVPARGKRPAKLPSEVDPLIQPVSQDQTVPWLVPHPILTLAWFTRPEHSPVAQRQSRRLLTARLVVRTRPGEPDLRQI